MLIYFLEGSVQRVESTLCTAEVCDWSAIEDADEGEDENESDESCLNEAEPSDDLFGAAEERSWAVYVEAISAWEGILGVPTFRSDTNSSGLQDDLYIQALTAWDRNDGLFEVTWGQIGSRPFTVLLTVWAPGSEGEYHYQRPGASPQRNPDGAKPWWQFWR